MAEKQFGLSRHERIGSRTDFDLVFREGRRLSEGAVLARYVPNGRPFTRMAVAVPGRLGNATKRNRARRMLKEAYRLHKHEMPPGIDIIFLPGRAWKSPPLAELEAAMKKIAARVAQQGSGAHR
ncbi:MAG TPA: ribonuclease P protein component [Planctomycetota bacterium]|nr:ribonuclease P protein component [Planctomycetota bacterium]